MTRFDGRHIKAGTIVPNRLASSILQKIAISAWGNPTVVSPTVKSVLLVLKDLAGNRFNVVSAVRVTCEEAAQLSVGSQGTVVSGSGTSDLIAKTNNLGRLEVLVTCANPATVTLALGLTKGSPILDASAIRIVTFP